MQSKTTARWAAVALALLAAAPSWAHRVPSVDEVLARPPVDAATQLRPALERLRANPPAGDARGIITGLRLLADTESAAPVAIKRYAQQEAPDALLAYARTSPDWAAKGDALLALRHFRVDARHVAQAAEIAGSVRNSVCEAFSELSVF